jgi:hypothetical protein
MSEPKLGEALVVLRVVAEEPLPDRRLREYRQRLRVLALDLELYRGHKGIERRGGRHASGTIRRRDRVPRQGDGQEQRGCARLGRRLDLLLRPRLGAGPPAARQGRARDSSGFTSPARGDSHRRWRACTSSRLK